jgi:hypothetical protein
MLLSKALTKVNQIFWFFLPKFAAGFLPSLPGRPTTNPSRQTDGNYAVKQQVAQVIDKRSRNSFKQNSSSRSKPFLHCQTPCKSLS